MDSPFNWRDLRDFSFGFQFWPFHWWPLWRFWRDDDRFGGNCTLTVGPFVFKVEYNGYDGPFAKPWPTIEETGRGE